MDVCYVFFLKSCIYIHTHNFAHILGLGGWKCNGCLVCEDCGARPEPGKSMRWSADYSSCATCARQRKNGRVCPVCKRAYKERTAIPMIQCDTCHQWVHASCDGINLELYDALGDHDRDYCMFTVGWWILKLLMPFCFGSICLFVLYIMFACVALWHLL